MSADITIICLENSEDISKKKRKKKKLLRVINQVTKCKPDIQSIVSFYVRHI